MEIIHLWLQRHGLNWSCANQIILAQEGVGQCLLWEPWVLITYSVIHDGFTMKVCLTFSTLLIVWFGVFFPAPDLNVRIIIPRFILLEWWTSTRVILLGANLTLISGGFLVLFYPPDTKLPWSAALMVKGTHAPLLYLTKIFCSTKVILVSWIIIFWSS